MSKFLDRLRRRKGTRQDEIKKMNRDIERRGGTSRYIDSSPDQDWNAFGGVEDGKSYLDHMVDLFEDPQFEAMIEQGKKLDGRYKNKIDEAWDKAREFMKNEGDELKEKIELEEGAEQIRVRRARLETVVRLEEYCRNAGMLNKAAIYRAEIDCLEEEIQKHESA